MSQACCALADPQAAAGKPTAFRQFRTVVNPSLHVLATVLFARPDGTECNDAVLGFVERLTPPVDYAGFEFPAPVLLLPKVFKPELCR